VASHYEVQKLRPRDLVGPERFKLLPEMFCDALRQSVLAQDKPPRGRFGHE